MTVATLRVCKPDGQNSKFRQRFPLFLTPPKKIKIITTPGFEPTQKNPLRISTLLSDLTTTGQNDQGETARFKYVCFGEFISGQRWEIQIFACATFIANFQNPSRQMFFSPKNNTYTFFYNSIAISEPKVTDSQKKIKMHPLSAILCLYICFFTHFVRFMLIYAFFFERENEAFVHRCAQGPSLSMKNSYQCL